MGLYVNTGLSFIIEKSNQKRLIYNWMRILLLGIKQMQNKMGNYKGYENG